MGDSLDGRGQRRDRPVARPPPLPVADLPAWEDDDVDDRLCWKTRALVAHAAGRPFVWLDDEPTAADDEYVAAHHPAPALLYRTDPEVGLTGADFEAVADWLRADVDAEQGSDGQVRAGQALRL